MATVFMKWLERKPSDYELGIRILTLGKISDIREAIVNHYIQPEWRVLEIGCGTGSLAVAMAQKGAAVEAIDAFPAMLKKAQDRVESFNLEEQVNLQLMDAEELGDSFSPGSFDAIVSTLVFSELPPETQWLVLNTCRQLLVPQGMLLIADEVIPKERFARFLYYLVHFPLTLLTWMLTRTSTNALQSFTTLLEQAGFNARPVLSYLNRSLVLYKAVIGKDAPRDSLEISSPIIMHLSSRATIKSILLDLWAVFFRIIPPYPKVRTGLYAIGSPSPDSPVLVTGNFALTVQRLVRAVDKYLDVWVLVVDSAGINVWCAAGGGYLTAGKVIAGIRTAQLEKVVNQHSLILPQLCANGVDGWKIRNETGWGVRWGPVRAKDIPAYINQGLRKTDQMRSVIFPIRDRLEMVSVSLGFYGLLILIPVWIFWRDLFFPLGVSLVSLSFFYALVHPWLPGKDGLHKSISLAAITLLGLFLFSWKIFPLTIRQLFNWSFGLVGLSVFTASEMQGVSPRMRGEQANWGWELLIAVILLLIYWLVPLFLEWR